VAIEVSEEGRLLLIRARGNVLPSQMEEVIRRFMAGEYGPAPKRRLVVFEPSARVDAMTWEALSGIHERAVAAGMRPPGVPQRVAIVARGAEHVGHARLCRSLWRSDPRSVVDVFITEDEAEARAWLLEEGPSSCSA
jgi:hypothetical protein